MTPEQPPAPKRPTTDELAGVYMYFEGGETAIPRPTDRPPVKETPSEFRNPTIEQLAGVNIYCTEGGEVIYLNGMPEPPPPPKPEQP